MRLYVSTGSPFARKCRVVLREKGLAGRVEEQTVEFPYKKDAEFLKANPIGQVPALLAEDGEPLFNSPVICAYLDSIGSEGRLLPAEASPEHWRVRRLEALADGLMEMTVKQVLEGRRPEVQRNEEWIGYWKQGQVLALDQLEAKAIQPEPIDLGVIATGIALTYLDFRMPDFDWRAGRPWLSALQGKLEKRESFRATFPK
jgi:glutathione S-transferase